MISGRERDLDAFEVLYIGRKDQIDGSKMTVAQRVVVLLSNLYPSLGPHDHAEVALLSGEAAVSVGADPSMSCHGFPCVGEKGV